MDESFQKSIKSWVQVDNQIKRLSTHVGELRSQRKNIQDHITCYAEENNLDNTVIEITDGSLRFNNYKQTAPLTFKYINKCFTKSF